MLDVGSGSGILSIAALMLGASGVDSIEINREAIRTTKASIEASGVSKDSTVIEGDIRETTELKGHYDLVMMNIESTGMILDIVARVSFDEMLVMPQTKDVAYLKSALEAVSLRVEALEEVERWTLLRCENGR